MNILAFDTSASACSVAVQHGSTVFERHDDTPRRQAALILPMIDDCLREATLTLNEIDTIAFGCGPGSFTGIRIASCVAQGLGYVAEKPIFPISTTLALAQTAANTHGCKHVLVAIDARRNEVYWAAYEQTEKGMKTIVPEEIKNPASVTIPPEANWFAVGDAFDSHEEALNKRLPFAPYAKDTTLTPTANALLRLTSQHISEQIPHQHAFDAMPVYLR